MEWVFASPQGTRQCRGNRCKPANADQILKFWCHEKDTHGARPLDDPKVIRPISLGRFDQSLRRVSARTVPNLFPGRTL